MRTAGVIAFVPLLGMTALVCAHAPHMPMPIDFQNSAEFHWLHKSVLESRMLVDMSNPGSWTMQGQAKLSWFQAGQPLSTRALRVDMEMFRDHPAPTRNGLAAVSLKRPFPGEDWTRYDRISLWIRPELSGATYRVDLRPAHVLDFGLAGQTSRTGEVTIRLTATGAGRHQFSIRAHNLEVDSPTQDLTLVFGKAAVLEWKAKVLSKDGPWVVVAIADQDMSRRRDLVGSAPVLESGN